MPSEIKKLIISKHVNVSTHTISISAPMTLRDGTDDMFRNNLMTTHVAVSSVNLPRNSTVTVIIEEIYGHAGYWPLIEERIMNMMIARAGWDPHTDYIEVRAENASNAIMATSKFEFKEEPEDSNDAFDAVRAVTTSRIDEELKQLLGEATDGSS